MSLEKSFKTIKVHLFSDVYWKRIPRDWTGVGEGAFTKLRT